MFTSFISTTVCPLARTIRQRRIALGMTQVELARGIGERTSWRAIQRLEAGKICMPSWMTLQALAEALKLPLERLLPAARPAGFATDDADLPNFAHSFDERKSRP